MPTYVADFIPPEILVSRREEAKERIEKLAGGADNAIGLVLDGTAGRTITEWAKDNDADCIVVASHRPVVSDLLLGSTAAWVVRHANCAVHVIR